MAPRRTGPVVVGCVASGVLASAVMVLAGPIAGAEEHVITGTTLLLSGGSWGLLAVVAEFQLNQPQRWAAALAGFLVCAGAALLIAAPGDRVLNALGWIWPLLFLALIARIATRVRRQLPGRSRKWIVYPMLTAYALCAVGGFAQTIGETLDQRAHAAPGERVDVGRHRLHLHCEGSGSPVVILESALGETAAYWEWVAPAVASHTTVCSYDRAGRGWSDAATIDQDGTAVATDLHTLLYRADVMGPFVLVGHSTGAQYVRIFAGRYPEEIAGMVLLDAQPAEAFEGLPGYSRFYSMLRPASAIAPSLARLGVARVLYPFFPARPSSVPDLLRAQHVSPRLYRSLRDEVAQLPTSLAEARSFQNLGDRPLVVVTATTNAMAGWLPLQDRMATLSRNSSHRLVPHAHEELVTDPAGARSSIEAIRDAVDAVRSNTPFTRQ